MAFAIHPPFTLVKVCYRAGWQRAQAPKCQVPKGPGFGLGLAGWQRAGFSRFKGREIARVACHQGAVAPGRSPTSQAYCVFNGPRALLYCLLPGACREVAARSRLSAKCLAWGPLLPGGLCSRAGPWFPPQGASAQGARCQVCTQVNRPAYSGLPSGD